MAVPITPAPVSQTKTPSASLALLLALLWAFMTAPGLFAIVVTTTVDENGDNPEACALREAVQAINDESSFGGCTFTLGDTLVELGAGTYPLSLGPGFDSRVELTASATIRGQGPNNTVIEGVQSSGHDLLVVNLGAPGAVLFEELTVRGARGNANAISFVAGSGHELVLRDLEVSDNDSSEAAFEIRGDNFGLARLERVIFEGNTNDNGRGGGIYCRADSLGQPPTLELEGVLFRNNISSGRPKVVVDAVGGGLLSSSCNLSLENVTFDSNSVVPGEAGAYGAGLALEDLGSSAQVSVTNVTFFNNSGGGLYQDSSENPSNTILTQVTFAANTTYHILQRDSAASLRNVVFGPSINDDCESFTVPEFTFLGGNMDSDGSCGVEQTAADPGFDTALRQHGGFAPTLALLDGSAAIDAGTNANCPATDQRGAPRPFDGDGDAVATCDVGAFEFLDALFFDSFESGDTGTWSAAVP